jgi:hypothetical protein
MYFEIVVEKNGEGDDAGHEKAEIEKLERGEIVKNGFDDSEGATPDESIQDKSTIGKLARFGH